MITSKFSENTIELLKLVHRHGITVNNLLRKNKANRELDQIKFNRDHVAVDQKGKLVFVNFEHSELELHKDAHGNDVNRCDWDDKKKTGCVELELLRMFKYFQTQNEVLNIDKEPFQKMQMLMKLYAAQTPDPRERKR